MLKGINEKNNRKNINKNAETLAALNTHTHTHRGLSFRK